MNVIKNMVASAVCVLVLASAVCSADDKSVWLTDMDEAQKLSKETGKSIFMFFTGSDWCGSCIVLKRDVLTKPEFVAFAADRYHLVELDVPSDEEIVGEEQMAHNTKWQNKFGIRGFPAVLLTDSSVNLYAKTGSLGRSTALEYIEHLTAVEANAKMAYAALGKAQGKSGLERAKLLDKALKAECVHIANRDELELEMVTLSAQDDALAEAYQDVARDKMLGEEMAAQLSYDAAPEENLSKALVLLDKYQGLKTGNRIGALIATIAQAYGQTGQRQIALDFLEPYIVDESYDYLFRAGMCWQKALLTAQEDFDQGLVLMERMLAMYPADDIIHRSRDHFIANLKLQNPE